LTSCVTDVDNCGLAFNSGGVKRVGLDSFGVVMSESWVTRSSCAVFENQASMEKASAY
jgi:hypothetical protein